MIRHTKCAGYYYFVFKILLVALRDIVRKWGTLSFPARPEVQVPTLFLQEILIYIRCRDKHVDFVNKSGIIMIGAFGMHTEILQMCHKINEKHLGQIQIQT